MQLNLLDCQVKQPVITPRPVSYTHLMPNATLLAEDIPVHPEEGIEMLQKMAETEKPALIIGTSMGGMYTCLLYTSNRISWLRQVCC